MGVLYLLEQIRTPLLDTFMLLSTHLGEETAFLVAAMIVFWCVDKRKGYYIMAIGFLGTLVNQFLKLLFRIPRPWILDPEFTIVEKARAEASGFSFPSGHSTSAVGTFGGIAYASRKPVVKWIFYTVCVLVPLSRMYLGVHTPADVLTGAATSVVLMVSLSFLLSDRGQKGMIWVMGAVLFLSVGLLLFAENYPFAIPAEQMENLHSGIKNAYTMLGTSVGILVIYPLEKKYVNFETKAVWWAQILKIVLGFALVLAVKEGLKSPLDALFAGHMAARALRYGLVVITAGLLWPMSFRWFSAMGRKK